MQLGHGPTQWRIKGGGMGDRQGPAVLRDPHFVEPPFLQTFTKLLVC